MNWQCGFLLMLSLYNPRLSLALFQILYMKDNIIGQARFHSHFSTYNHYQQTNQKMNEKKSREEKMLIPKRKHFSEFEMRSIRYYVQCALHLLFLSSVPFKIFETVWISLLIDWLWTPFTFPIPFFFSIRANNKDYDLTNISYKCIYSNMCAFRP